MNERPSENWLRAMGFRRHHDGHPELGHYHRYHGKGLGKFVEVVVCTDGDCLNLGNTTIHGGVEVPVMLDPSREDVMRLMEMIDGESRRESK